MTVATESGYTWTDGKHARILHGGNKFAIKTVTATEETLNGPASRVVNPLTAERWKPFDNGASDATELDEDAWTLTNVTVASDGWTITETTDDGEHSVSQAYTFTAVEHVLAFYVERETVPTVQIVANDGTDDFTCFFDLRDGTIGEELNATGQIVDLGDGEYLLSIYFTPAAATGTIAFHLSDGREADYPTDAINPEIVADFTDGYYAIGSVSPSYAGDTDSTVKVKRASIHVSTASLRLDTFTAQSGTCIAIAAHNLGSAGARLAFEHDSDKDGTWTTIGTITPSDDSTIMFFFDAISSQRWRITVDRGALPEIGVLWVGDPLKMERPFYAGFTPARMNRRTEVRGNMSRSGELLGRSVVRTILSEDYQWNNLTYAWVRTNLDGPNGLIQNAEAKPLFVAWRPELTEDVSYVMRAATQPPSAAGKRDLWDFSMSGEVYSYE